MKEKNNKTLLIALGIFALVIVTTAASFAFFTYSRVGNTTTTITSGDIEFSYIEGDNASLANAFPIADSVGAVDTSHEYIFYVKMSSSSTSNKINYNVILLDDNKQAENYFTNEQIKFALVKNGTYVANTSSTEGVKLSTIAGFDEGLTTGEGIVLEEQEITSGTTDTYKLRIWISDDVNYSNTELTDDNTDIENDAQESIGKYNGYKFSLKVKITTSGMSNSIDINLSSVGRTIIADLSDINGLDSYAVTTTTSAPSESDWIDITSDTAKSNVLRTTTNIITSKTINHMVESNGTYYVHVKNKLNQTKYKSIDVNPYVDNSGASYPVIKGDLVPVVISDTGIVTKANLNEKWYDYDESIWANAVILTDDAPTIENGTTIDEKYIESYFVWIPRYRYKIFNEGNYSELTEINSNAIQTIEIEFETKSKTASTGSTVGTWLTHPAFTSFDTNGLWVGKFESGYNGATTPEEAEIDDADASRIIIKPNVYSWRYITVGNAFKTSYDYLRNLDSHMMKNTEWGAVAYLQHSKYGNIGSLRINNNSAYITGYSATVEPTLGYSESSIKGNRHESTALGVDGTHTVNYKNTKSVISSTTGNYSGVYDMSGGAWEYVMGYNTGSNIGVGGESGITSVISDFFNNSAWNKYYNRYPETVFTNFSNRILGDATGEMGPFFSETDGVKSSWYGDETQFTISSHPWFYRGGPYFHGTLSGAFAFDGHTGGVYTHISFRVVLTP